MARKDSDDTQETQVKQNQTKQLDVPPGCLLVKDKRTGQTQVRMRVHAEALLASGHYESIPATGKV